MSLMIIIYIPSLGISQLNHHSTQKFMPSIYINLKLLCKEEDASFLSLSLAGQQWSYLPIYFLKNNEQGLFCQYEGGKPERAAFAGH